GKAGRLAQRPGKGAGIDTEAAPLDRKLVDHGRAAAKHGKRGGMIVVRPAGNRTVGEGLQRRWIGRLAHRGRRARLVPHSTDSVAIRFQLGSREDTSRANVQMSVTSPTWTGSPSITAPDLSRVAEMSSDRKRIVICPIPLFRAASVISALSMPTNLNSIVSWR